MEFFGFFRDPTRARARTGPRLVQRIQRLTREGSGEFPEFLDQPTRAQPDEKGAPDSVYLIRPSVRARDSLGNVGPWAITEAPAPGHGEGIFAVYAGAYAHEEPALPCQSPDSYPLSMMSPNRYLNVPIRS